jgi:hypothetical protein
VVFFVHACDFFFFLRARAFFFCGGSLFCAASAGHASIVALLLAHGADPRARTATGAGAAPRDLAHAKVGTDRPILLCKLLFIYLYKYKKNPAR